jgi:hypothetical protein
MIQGFAEEALGIAGAVSVQHWPPVPETESKKSADVQAFDAFSAQAGRLLELLALPEIDRES